MQAIFHLMDDGSLSKNINHDCYKIQLQNIQNDRRENIQTFWLYVYAAFVNEFQFLF